MNQDTLTKFHAVRGLTAMVAHNLDVIAGRLDAVGMNKLARELLEQADIVHDASIMVDAATGEAVGEYFRQSVEGSNNMLRAAVAMAGGNPDETFPLKQES